MPDSSIIIVTYNGLREHTIPCLESVFAHSGGGTYEVIVVDNNSSDGTPAYLEELARREPRLKLVLNQANRGFAGGNNDGLRIASGDVIVLLNNDTRVTSGWLDTLGSALRNDPGIGLVGPVSNAVGNEQKIYTVGTTPEQILDEGIQWVNHSIGDTFETERLGFFCVAMRRDLIDVVGVLDEAYDLGFFEDDDYCVRVIRAGFRLVCCEDVFIYHHGSASFAKVPRRTKELLKKNRRLLEKKINLRYNPRHPRDRQLDLVDSYLEKMIFSDETKPLQYKVENRLQAIGEQMPRGLFKRWWFMRRLEAVRVRMRALFPDPQPQIN